MTFQGCFLPCFHSFVKVVSEKKQELLLAAMLVNRSEVNENLYKGSSKETSYQDSIHLAQRLQRRRFFRNRPIRNKNCLWWPSLLNRSELNQQSLLMNFQGCFLPCFDSFGKVVSEKIFQKSTNQKKELLLMAMFVNGSELNEQSL